MNPSYLLIISPTTTNKPTPRVDDGPATNHLLTSILPIYYLPQASHPAYPLYVVTSTSEHLLLAGPGFSRWIEMRPGPAARFLVVIRQTDPCSCKVQPRPLPIRCSMCLIAACIVAGLSRSVPPSPSSSCLLRKIILFHHH